MMFTLIMIIISVFFLLGMINKTNEKKEDIAKKKSFMRYKHIRLIRLVAIFFFSLYWNYCHFRIWLEAMRDKNKIHFVFGLSSCVCVCVCVCDWWNFVMNLSYVDLGWSQTHINILVLLISSYHIITTATKLILFVYYCMSSTAPVFISSMKSFHKKFVWRHFFRKKINYVNGERKKYLNLKS